MKMISTRIPTDLHERIRIYVEKEGMTIQGFIRKSIELYLMKLSTRTSPLPGQVHMCTCIPDEEGNCTCKP